MKQLFTTAVLLFSATAFAQVGINNTSPKATLDITAKTTDGSKPEGLIIPQVAGNQIRTATASGIYGASQKGLIVYASSADSSPAGATVNITAPGYYYFDGSIWQRIAAGGSSLNTTLNSGNIYVGNASNVATALAPTGDVTISNTGVTSIGSGKVTSSQIADGTVSNADLATAAALTVKGNATNATATPTDIAAGTDGYVLRRSGTALGFGTVATAGIADNAVTVAKLPSGATATTFLRGDGTWVTPTDTNTTYTAGTGLSLSGTTFSATDASTSAKGIVQLAGDLAGTAASPTVAKIQNNAVSATAPTSGQVLGWNGTAWAPTANGISTTLNSGNILVGNASNVATAVTPSGDVTISNTGVTSIGTGKVTSTHIADGTVANADLNSGVGGIYKGNGSLSGNTTVTQGSNTLTFSPTVANGFSIDNSTLSVDGANHRVGIGTTTPNSMLQVSGSSGDHIRMTNTGSDWALGSENAGGQNGISGQSSLTITNRTGNFRAMTIGTDNSFRLGGSLSVGNAAFSIDGPTNKVGIGINVPNATLDVKAASNGSTPEGIIAPRLSLTALQGYTYGTNQTGAIVYVSSASGTPTGQTANVTATGYYFFDGTNWQKVASGNTLGTSLASGNIYVGNASGAAAAVTPSGDVTISNTGVTSIGSGKVTSSQIADGTVANADLSTGVGGIYKGDGSLSGNTTVTQGTNTLAFTSTATTGTSHFTVDGTTLNVDAANDRVGIGTSSPQATLDVVAKTTDGSKPEGFIAPRLAGDDIQKGDSKYTSAQKGAIVYALSAATTPSTKTANIDAEGYYFFDGSVWKKLLSQSQNVSTQILSVSVPGNQNISGASGVTTQFTTETLDVFNAWTSNNFTVPANKGGTYSVSSQTSNTHTISGATNTWYVMLILQKSTDGGTTWSDLTKDTRSGLTYGDIDNGNLIFWTGTLNAGDKIKLISSCSSSTNNIISIGSLNISKL